MQARRCNECGPVFRDRPVASSEDNTCPLCGAELKVRERVELDGDEYQTNVRALREELRRLRSGEAEAV